MTEKVVARTFRGQVVAHAEPSYIRSCHTCIQRKRPQLNSPEMIYEFWNNLGLSLFLTETELLYLSIQHIQPGSFSIQPSVLLDSASIIEDTDLQ